MADPTLVQKAASLGRRFSLVGKLTLIGAVLLVLTIFSSQVRDQIGDRAATRREAIAEISGRWGGNQEVVGPVLLVPYVVQTPVYEKGKLHHWVGETRQANFLPDTLSVDGVLQPELRSRGIYQAVLYRAELDLEGTFAPLDLRALGIEESSVIWNEVTLSLGLGDTRGIREAMRLSWGDATVPFGPGLGGDNTHRAGNGVHAIVPAARNGLAKGLEKGPVRFRLHLALDGSGSLHVAPAGRTTTVALRSTWKDPSFTGAWLPESREVTAAGFQARWTVHELARNFPQRWTGSTHDDALGRVTFGVQLLVTASAFQQTERAIKYALLFLVLTFTAFFLFEVRGGRRLHPLQYLLVGAAVVLFYLLLLALSEHLGFGAAYALAGAAVLLAVGGYTKAILGGAAAAGISALLAGLLSFLYTVLQLEDFALLLGALGLFAALAAVMWLTRRMDWYALSDPSAPANAAGP